MKLKTDLERAEFIMRLPFIRDFEIKNKSGIKCVEKAVKYREEGNKLFQSEQCTQAILFYNKSISYCPHPTYDQWQQGLEQEQEKVKEVQFADECKDPNKKVPSKYESLSLSYGNRQTCKRCLTMFKDGEYNIFGDACLNKLFPPKLGTYLQRSSCEGFEDKGSISDGNTWQANILLRFLKCADCIFYIVRHCVHVWHQVGGAAEAEPVRGLSEGHRPGGQVRLPQGQHLQVVGAEGEVLRGGVPNEGSHRFHHHNHGEGLYQGLLLVESTY